MKRADDPLRVVTRKLDLTRILLEGYDCLARRGVIVDQHKITSTEGLYAHNLELLGGLGTPEKLQEYTMWWRRYWNGGDAL